MAYRSLACTQRTVGRSWSRCRWRRGLLRLLVL